MSHPNPDTTSQIQTEISQLLVRVRLNSDAIGAVRHLLEHYRGMVQKYVARAVAAANPNNGDADALQGALENLNTLNAEIDAQAAAVAAVLSTDADDASTTDPMLTNGIVPPTEKPANPDAPSLPETDAPATPTPPVGEDHTGEVWTGTQWVPAPAPEPVPDQTSAEMQAGADALAANLDPNSTPLPGDPIADPALDPAVETPVSDPNDPNTTSSS